MPEQEWSDDEINAALAAGERRIEIREEIAALVMEQLRIVHEPEKLGIRIELVRAGRDELSDAERAEVLGLEAERAVAEAEIASIDRAIAALRAESDQLARQRGAAILREDQSFN